MPIVRFLVSVLLVCGAVQFGMREANACSVPVFRYALERWKPDPYKAIFIHRGEITQRDKALLQQLEAAASNEAYPLNLMIRPVDVNTFSEARLKDVLKGSIPAKLPVLAIWFPEQMGKKPPQWTIDLTDADVKALTGSPKRMEIAERLIKGESIVWVFIPSGHQQKDTEARELIKRESAFAVTDLDKMPFFTSAGTKEKKLTYSFPLLTVSRSDPEERFFVDMLMKTESDLYEHTEDPMIFPVFGRGRVLGCLFGEYISKNKIQGVISFLAASCSCEVKALNPGLDLLLPAQWDRVLLGALYADDETLPALTGVMPGKTTAAVTKEESAAQPRENRNNGNLLKLSGFAMSSLFVIVVFAGLVLNRRRK